MTTPSSQSRCFLDTQNLYRNDGIPLEEHLRDYVSHLCKAIRHKDCRNLSSTSVSRLAAYDVVEGAVAAAMLDEDAVVPNAESLPQLSLTTLGRAQL